MSGFRCLNCRRLQPDPKGPGLTACLDCGAAIIFIRNGDPPSEAYAALRSLGIEPLGIRVLIKKGGFGATAVFGSVPKKKKGGRR
jgi:hypothetical protein